MTIWGLSYQYKVVAAVGSCLIDTGDYVMVGDSVSIPNDRGATLDLDLPMGGTLSLERVGLVLHPV